MPINAYTLINELIPIRDGKTLNPQDLTITTYNNAIPNAGNTMRITHNPTGIHVQDTGKSACKLRQRLMAQLKDKVGSTGYCGPYGC